MDMDPTAEANKKRPLLIDLNELPPSDPEDSSSGETDQDSLRPPPSVEVAAAAGFKSDQRKETKRQVDEKEDERSERKIRKLRNEYEPWTAGDDGGGVHAGKVREWEKWRAVIQTVAWESGDKKLVHWMELMDQERQVKGGSTARNGPRPDKDNNAADEVVPAGAAPPVEIPAAASPEVVTRKSQRIRMSPSKFKDSFLL